MICALLIFRPSGQLDTTCYDFNLFLFGYRIACV